MLIALRFGAKCVAKNKGFDHHFFVIADANLASFFFKEKCKNIVNGKKLRRKAPEVGRRFTILLHFI